VRPDDSVRGSGASATTNTSGPVTETGIAPAKADAAPIPVESPKNVSVDSKYKALGSALRDSGTKPGQVQEEAIRILGINPNDSVALNSLAMLHLHHGRTGAAKLLLSRALEKNPPEAAGLHNNLGVALLDEGQQDAAIVEFKKALALDQGHIEAIGNLGSIYAKAGDYAKALPMLETSYKRNRNNIAILNNYAIALRGAKDLEGAKRVYEEALKINSRDVNTILNLAILYIDYMNRAKDGLDLVYKVKFIETQRKDVLSRANALEKKAKSELK
jgi:tetratricopeptide (TPR) repeat protein